MITLDRLIGYFAPHDCVVCGAEGHLLCEVCRYEVFPSIPERCYKCYSLSAGSRTCRRCRSRSPLSHVWVAAEYDGVAKELLHRLKFRRAMGAATVIAQQMADSLPFLGNIDYLTAAPTATSRMRQRGYDQAELIAVRLAALRNIPVESMLLRIGQSRQVGANRAARLIQLEQAFAVPEWRKQHVSGKHVLLVDDMLTTGATLESAARKLKEAGAKSVSAAVFAQKV